MARQVIIITHQVDISIMSARYLFQLLQENEKKTWKFPLGLYFSLTTNITMVSPYTYLTKGGLTLHLPRQSCLNRADINVWPPGGSI